MTVPPAVAQPALPLVHPWVLPAPSEPRHPCSVPRELMASARRWPGSRSTTPSASAASTAAHSLGTGTPTRWWSAPSSTGMSHPGGVGGDTHRLAPPHPPTLSWPRSGHCYYQMVVTPVIEQILPDSPASRIPHTVTLVSIPACSDGKRGFSVSIDQGCGTEHPRTVRVRECVCVPSVTVPSPGLGASSAPSAGGIHPTESFWDGRVRDGAVPVSWGWPEGTVVACPQLLGWFVGTVVACPQPSRWLEGDVLALHCLWVLGWCVPACLGWLVGTVPACPHPGGA